ncbi:MAG: adenylate/guanylate cyclase domain-containing protein [Candidatus Limnocylindrales bacterium]
MALGSADHAGAPSAASAAERRLVSVLFADLVGFTPFAEERDAEEVRDVLTRYFDLASEVIQRYGGTVEKFIGDAVMAVWGTPTARENDPERAVRAALELVDAIRTMGPGIQVRAGVHTGEAAVTLGATNQGMVAGDVVNTAARIQSAAPPGAVLVGEATHHAASAAIVFEDAGQSDLKGKSAPVAIWRALRVVAERGGRGRSDTLEAPFVGRDDQLRLLKELYHATARERRTRLVSITGIGGIGKSRLAWEFEKYLDGVVEKVWWHHGRSPAYGQGVTFWALGEMVRTRCGLVESDDETQTRAKVAAAVATHVPDEAERRWIESSLLTLLGVEPAASGAEELFAGWRTFFERLSTSAPVVMVFEDLHWADPGTLDFIDHLLDWAKAIPLAIITLARPELLERRPDWGGGRRNFVGLDLEPLPEPAMRALLAGLAPGLPEATVRRVVQRADGIPLYAVETVRMLVAEHRLEERDGVYVPLGDLDTLAIPDTLTALIAARLDALEAAERNLLLDAAVLGQSFSLSGLAAVAGSSAADLGPLLKTLVRREILALSADPLSPERGQYSFVQALTREVAYNTLARRDRKERHLAAARFFESLGSDELAGALAGQYLAAHDNAAEGPEADALAAQARLALSAAAERAAALGAHRQAVTLFEQALSVTSDPDDAATFDEQAGRAAADAADYDAAVAHLEAARRQRAAAGDRSATAKTIATLGQTLLSAKRVDAGRMLLESAAAEFADLSATPEVAAVNGQLARAYQLSEEPGRAVEVADRVLATAEHGDLIPLLADTLVTKGTVLQTLGHAREGAALLEAGLRLAETHGLPLIGLRATNNQSVWLADESPRRALETLRAGLATARRLGVIGWVTSLAGGLSDAAFRAGEWQLARVELAATLPEASEPYTRALMSNNLLDILAARGEPSEEALAAMREALSGFDPNVKAGIGNEAEGWLALARGDATEAHRLWREMADAIPSNASASLQLAARAAVLGQDLEAARRDLADLDAIGIHGTAIEAVRTTIRAGIAGLEGRRGESLALYRSANASWRDLDLPWDAARTALEMITVLGPGEVDAQAAGAEARQTFTTLGARPFLAQLEALLGAGPAPAPSTSAAAEPRTAEGRTAGAGQPLGER